MVQNSEGFHSRAGQDVVGRPPTPLELRRKIESKNASKELPVVPTPLEAAEEVEATPETPIEKLEVGFGQLAEEVRINEENIHQIFLDQGKRHDTVEKMENTLKRMEQMLKDFEERNAQKFAEIETMITLLSKGDIPAEPKGGFTSVRPLESGIFTADSKGTVDTPQGAEKPVYGTSDKSTQTVELEQDTKDSTPTEVLDVPAVPIHEPGKEVALREVHSQELVVTGPEDTHDLEKQLQGASDKYAELTAKSRNGYAGRFLRSSKYLVRIAPLRVLAEKLNERTDVELDKARNDYEQAISESQSAIAMIMRAENPEGGAELAREIHHNTTDFLSRADVAFEEKLLAERMSRSKKTNGFVNWWVRQDSLGGKIVKGLSVAGAGLAAGGAVTTVGAVTGAFLLPGVGAAVGAVAGAYIGHHVTKRRANAVGKDGLTLAERQSSEDIARKQKVIEDKKSQNLVYEPNPDYDQDAELKDPRPSFVVDSKGQADTHEGDATPHFTANKEVIDKNAIVTARDLTNVTEERTAAEMAANRRRVATATSIGASGGGLADTIQGLANIGGGEAEQLSRVVDNSQNGLSGGVEGADLESGFDTSGSGTESLPTPDQLELVDGDLPGATEINEPSASGAEFTVENGSGMIRELQQFAEATGHNISGSDAEGLYNALVQRFGAENIIDMTNSAQDIYQMADGGVGINGPGTATWRAGVEQFAGNWLTSQGL